jgi:hypothetical protein
VEMCRASANAKHVNACYKSLSSKIGFYLTYTPAQLLAVREFASAAPYAHLIEPEAALVGQGLAMNGNGSSHIGSNQAPGQWCAAPQCHAGP